MLCHIQHGCWVKCATNDLLLCFGLSCEIRLNDVCVCVCVCVCRGRLVGQYRKVKVQTKVHHIL